jgi:PKD repeat protein
VLDLDETVTFDGIDSADNEGVVEWVWTFVYDGDVVTLDGVTAEWTFGIPGEYVVNLTVMDAAGNNDSVESIMEVIDREPPTALVRGPEKVRVGKEVAFDGVLSTDNVGIVDWYWVITYQGQTTGLDGETIRYTFAKPGQYMVSLEVVDAEGLSNFDIMTVKVIDDEAGGGGDISPWTVLLVVLVLVGVGVVVGWTRFRGR